ncbi:hypothetical protein PG994_008206 [Apiospora phragmitis]|uniref:Uncharacterized protein n=1 Tax=Apiospora phragmitis TaxID=2905665 RepID=A0ABR1USD2_9PEZI
MAPLINQLPVLTPTRTLPSLLTRALHPRQATATIITTDVDTTEHHDVNLSGGAIAGIVIGSIVGFLLLLWLIRSCLNLGKPGIWGSTFGAKDDPPPRSTTHAYPYHHETHRSRSRHHHHHHRSHSHGHSPRRKSIEIRQVSTVRPAAGYYETTRVASRGRSPAAPPAAYYPPQEARHVRRESRRASRGDTTEGLRMMKCDDDATTYI